MIAPRTTPTLRILNCEVERSPGERIRADVEVANGRILRIRGAGDLRRDRSEADGSIEAEGGALLPSLHDHHIHVFALAAARASVDCSPQRVRSAEELSRALLRSGTSDRARATSGVVRGVGYHEAIAGDLDRAALDALAPGRAVRVQHRSGALWMLNSAALASANLAGGAPSGGWPEGAELDAQGRSNGRFFRLDDWLSERLEPGTPRGAPDLSEVSRELAAYGVASFTDATPRNDANAARSFAAAQSSGALLQRVRLMGAAGPIDGFPILAGEVAAALHWGERKLVLDDRNLPALDDVAALVAQAHEQGRSVAIHCVTRSELVLAAGAIELAGLRPGDRVEHASIAAPDALEWLARLGVAVVTQPGFIAERGDAYLRDVHARDRPWLYRCAGFDKAGIALGAGTDAPYASADPWRAMRAAVDRKTPTGRVLGDEERVTPERALALFTSPAHAPGGPTRRVAKGELADLVLLDCDWARAREALECAHVRATLQAGRVIESRVP